MTSRISNTVRDLPGARPAWRFVWGRYNAAKSLARSVRAGVQIASDTASMDAYGTSGRQKPTRERVADNVLWAVRHGGANPFYYAFGMDAKSGAEYDRYLSVQEMMTILSHQIKEDGAETPTAVLKDKYFFSLVAGALGHRTPRVYALLGPTGVDLLDPRREVSYADFLATSEAIDGFAKPVGGEKGRGAFALRIDDGAAWVDGAPATAAEIATRVPGRFLLQERVVQHPALAALHSASVNTVRLVTVLRDGAAVPFVAALRVGTGGTAVDNWSAGGLVVGLDLDRGQLVGRGIFKPGCGGDLRYGGTVDRHPDSGIVLDGYALPEVDETVALACRLHDDMGGPRSVGWDLAMTPDGPTVVEGNSHWSGAMYMAIDPSFKERYFEIAGIRG